MTTVRGSLPSLLRGHSNPRRQYTSKMPASSIFSWGVRTRQSLRLPAIRRSLPLFHIMLYARIPVRRRGYPIGNASAHSSLSTGARWRGRGLARDRCWILESVHLGQLYTIYIDRQANLISKFRFTTTNSMVCVFGCNSGIWLPRNGCFIFVRRLLIYYCGLLRIFMYLRI